MLTRMDSEQALGLPNEEEGAPPVLVLGVHPWGRAGTPGAPQGWTFRDDRPWFWIDHQAGGLGCSHPEFVCTRLAWKPQVLPAFVDIAARYWDASWHFQGPTLQDIVEFNHLLQAIHPAVTCNETFRDLEEAVYPIDLSPQALQVLTATVLPADLDDLVHWRQELDRVRVRWQLWVLGSNSD